MDVALVSTPFVPVPPRAYGGTELVVDALARALVRAGHRVTLFATGDSAPAPGRELQALFPRAVWPPDPYAEMLHCRFAADAIAARRFDVVHAHAPALLVFSDRLRAPVVATLHHAADPALARLHARFPEVTRVAISARQAELADPPPHAVVHHGLEPDMYPVVGPGGDDALFLGRLSWQKAPEVAVEAARRAGVRLVMAGRAHPDRAPERWAEDVLAPALAAPHVRWLGELSLAGKRRQLARARALLVPLRWEEPFGLVMIEALLAGCPVIASPRGAAPEIVEHGRTGFLARDVRDLAAALRRASALDRGRIQARARERFGSDRMAAAYVAIYEAARARAAAGAEGSGWTSEAR